MRFTAKDGELRIYDRQSSNTGYYIVVLFTNADMTFPIGRAKVEETLNMDRGNMNASAAYSEGPDSAITDPLPLSFSANMEDTTYTDYLRYWLSGTTLVNTHTLFTDKGNSSLTVGSTVVSTPSFADGSKMAYRVEVLWDGSNSYGWDLREVYFPPDQQTITENEDSVVVNINGLCYGSVTTMTSFTSGTTIQTV